MKKHVLFISFLCMIPIFSNAQNKTIDVNGVQREYLLHIPDNLAPAEKVPVVIALHLLGSTAESFETYTKFSDKADQEGFIAVYPQGYGNSWNAGGCCSPAINEGIDDIGFISALIDTLIDEQPVDSDKVFITGFSNGGIMCYALASEISEKIAGIAPVGALFMMEENHATNPVPIIHLHALDDGSVRVNGQDGWSSVYDLLDEWKVINGITAGPDTFRNDSKIKGIMYPSPDSSANIILYLSENGGHSYSLNYRLGTTNRIWEFFSTQINKAPIILDTIAEGSRKRDYKTHIPTAYFSDVDNTAKYPLILAAHGWNQTAAQMEEYTKFSSLANSNDFFVNYLHYVGPPPDMSWNYHMDPAKPDDIGYAKAVIDSMFARYPIDSSKVYAVGFSDGCGLANRLPFETDGLVSATGTVGGMIEFDAGVTTTPVRMIHFHAKNDPAVNYSNVRNNTLNYWLDVNECTTDPDTIVNERNYIGESWKNTGDETAMIFYTLPWSAHDWPVDGESGMLLSASELMWEFFSKGNAVATIPPGVGIQEKQLKNGIKIFPCPAYDHLSIQLETVNEGLLTIQIFDIKGNEVNFPGNTKIQSGDSFLDLDIADLPVGCYIIKISGNKLVYQEKFVVL